MKVNDIFIGGETLEIVYRLAPMEVAATNDASDGLQEDNNVEGNFDLGPFDADTDEVTYQPETTNNYKVTVFFCIGSNAWEQIANSACTFKLTNLPTLWRHFSAPHQVNQILVWTSAKTLIYQTLFQSIDVFVCDICNNDDAHFLMRNELTEHQRMNCPAKVAHLFLFPIDHACGVVLKTDKN